MEEAEHGADAEVEEEEEALRQFDMDTSYGPCIGITRLRRGSAPPRPAAQIRQQGSAPPSPAPESAGGGRR